MACGAAPQPAATPAAVFDWFEYSGRDAWFEQPAQPGGVRNPILAGFYPDPSIVRADDGYYMVTSTFSWYPGVPIFRSEDLVNWTQIGHVLDHPSLLPVEGKGVSRGVFAPTIRYHDGIFYMINTLVDAGGNFYVTATDPAGPWSEPVWLPEIDGIDPSILFDDDGRVYVTNNGPPDYEPLYEGHRALWIQELDLAAGKLIGPRKMIVDGGVDLETQPIWIEAPHIFKVDDWYVLIAAEGGTEFYHSEVVFRSRAPFGPYEPGPVNPILTQRTLDPERPFPVIASGHADFVQTPEGDWWAVFLACRPYEGMFYNTGRETFLHPVTWQDGWPMILDPSKPVPLALARPDLTAAQASATPYTDNFTWREEFDARELGFVWNSLRGPSDAWLDLESHEGAATMTPMSERLSGSSTPAFLARRQQHASFSASASMRMPMSSGMSAGIAVFQNEQHHFYLGVRRVDSEWSIFLEQAAGGEPEAFVERALSSGDGDSIELRVDAEGRPYSFTYRLEGGDWITLAEGLDGSILSTHVAGGFVGSYIGLHVRVE
ncbi:MAG: glycoside hydrolase family 43 protein [Acidimicrobiia bacterium]|nr:glycoside hydrolase family 43 protein [Acidimicrobiia bacterium]